MLLEKNQLMQKKVINIGSLGLINYIMFLPIPKDTFFNEIIVETLDTVRFTALLDMLIITSKICPCCGSNWYW